MQTLSLTKSYELHAKTVYRVCYTLTKNTHDAEDMTSDTFVKLMNCVNPFESDEHEKAWLIRTATNLCKDLLKSHWRKITQIPESLTHSDNHETADLLEKVLSLPENIKLAVYLHYYEGYKTSEIAKMLGKPEPTVRGYLHRGRKSLKIKIESEE